MRPHSTKTRSCGSRHEIHLTPESPPRLSLTPSKLIPVFVNVELHPRRKIYGPTALFDLACEARHLGEELGMFGDELLEMNQ